MPSNCDTGTFVSFRNSSDNTVYVGAVFDGGKGTPAPQGSLITVDADSTCTFFDTCPCLEFDSTGVHDVFSMSIYADSTGKELLWVGAVHNREEYDFDADAKLTGKLYHPPAVHQKQSPSPKVPEKKSCFGIFFIAVLALLAAVLLYFFLK